MQTQTFAFIKTRCLTTVMLLLFGHAVMGRAEASAGELNVPPEGFTALFNGEDLTGWHTPPDVLANWSVEDGVLKSPGLVEHYRASLVTEPQVKHIEPEVGVWHTVKLTMQGRTFSAEYDGELIHDRFQYHDWMLNMEPAPIRLQKHKVVYGENLGQVNPCPIEYRNIFIKELEPGITDIHTQSHARTPIERKSLNSPYAELLTRIGRNELPEGYHFSTHQEYVAENR